MLLGVWKYIAANLRWDKYVFRLQYMYFNHS